LREPRAKHLVSEPLNARVDATIERMLAAVQPGKSLIPPTEAESTSLPAVVTDKLK
jgi:hypothetical protein